MYDVYITNYTLSLLSDHVKNVSVRPANFNVYAHLHALLDPSFVLNVVSSRTRVRRPMRSFIWKPKQLCTD